MIVLGIPTVSFRKGREQLINAISAEKQGTFVIQSVEDGFKARRDLSAAEGDVDALKQKVSAQCDLLTLGASRLVRVSLVYQWILGMNLESSDFYKIHKDEAALFQGRSTSPIDDREGFFKEQVFQRIREHLKVEEDSWKETDTPLERSLKTASSLRKYMILAVCDLTYEIVRKLSDPYIKNRVAALQEILFVNSNDLVKHKNFLLEGIQSFLQSYLSGYDSLVLSGQDSLNVLDYMKGYLQNPERFINEEKTRKEFAQDVVKALLPVIDGEEMLGKIPTNIRPIIQSKIESAFLVPLVENLLESLETCIRDPNDNTMYSIDVAVTGLLKNLQKILTTPAKQNKTARVVTEVEKKQTKEIVDSLYFAAQYARCSTKEEVAVVFDKCNYAKWGESDWFAHSQNNGLITPSDDLLKTMVLDPWIEANAGMIQDLLDSLLEEKFVLGVANTSLANLNALLFFPQEEVPLEEKIQARKDRVESTKKVLNVVVHTAVKSFTDPYLERVKQASQRFPIAAEVVSYIGSVGASVWSSIFKRQDALSSSDSDTVIGLLDKKMRVTDRITRPFEDLIDGIMELVASPVVIPGLVTTLGNKWMKVAKEP